MLISDLVAQVEPPSPYGWRILLDDLKAGLVSVLVNTPLAMGIGIVSGMGVTAALHSAVIVGIVSALLGGTRAMKREADSRSVGPALGGIGDFLAALGEHHPMYGVEGGSSIATRQKLIR